MQNRELFKRQNVINSLIADLYKPNDNGRTLTALDVQTANELLMLFGIHDPGMMCRGDPNGMVNRENLRCLNSIYQVVRANPYV